MSKLYPASTIRFADIDGLTVIMDLNTEDYYVFNETATLFWSLIIENDGDLMVGAQALKGNRQTATNILEKRLHTFFADCLEHGFLTQNRPVVDQFESKGCFRSKSNRFLTLQAWWNLVLTAYYYRVNGFARTYNNYAQLRFDNSNENLDQILKSALASFLKAENLFWYNQAPRDCLPRSLALFRFLRSLGIQVIHYIGGRRFPGFTMHAWVEYNGNVVLDDSQQSMEYTVISSLPRL